MLERAAARQHREVLQHDRVGERAEHLVRRDAALDQVDDVGLGEDAALGRDVVELGVVEVERRHELRRRVHLEEALVDGGAGAATRTCRSSTAMAVLSPVFSSFLNMMILASCPPSSMTLPDVGVEVLDRERDRVDLLHELAAGRRAERRRAGAGQEDAPLVAAATRGTRLEDRLEQLEARSRAASCGAAGSRSRGSPCRRVEDHGLHRRGADVHPDAPAFGHVWPAGVLTRLTCQSVTRRIPAHPPGEGIKGPFGGRQGSHLGRTRPC